VRSIAEVATAVTKGDLTRSIMVEAQGEVASLSNTINEMIRNLRDTTQKNTEQDWLKTNLAKFSRLLQGERNLSNVGRMVLSELCPVVSAQQAEFYVLDTDREAQQLTLLAGYASDASAEDGKRIRLGQGLVGQCALEKQKMLIDELPPDYIRVSSGLGSAPPRSILVLPLIFEGQVRGVLELASMTGFNSTHQAFLEQLTESIGIVLNTIEANMRTEDLLQQSTALAQELQTRQEELQQTNKELQEKSQSLARQNQEVERKNEEVEQARQALEEKAKQLALTSKYKSEFLANMSHELRTPLNSLLILSDQLSKNPEGNLQPKQLEFAKTIHSSGNDLLMLINDILDLSKIESGTVVVDAGELRLNDLQGYVERTFRHVAEQKNLAFLTRFDPRLPKSMYTDSKRLQQIIKNLLSNAFKFTHHGQVTLSVEPATSGWSRDNDELNRATEVMAFSVADTGIGIPADKQQIIFEAFQQADGSTSRKYGGTGLGLAISREQSRVLGGEIRLASTPARGSIFVLYLPTVLTPRPSRKPSGTEIVPVPHPHEAARPPMPLSTRAIEPEIEPETDYGDDRNAIRPGDSVLLIVENDLTFARFILDAAREKGMKALITPLGATALAMARDFNPGAISLDIHLPDIDGWRVLERLKRDPATRHVPVCVVSTDDARDRAFEQGSLAFLAKPIPSKDLLDSLLDFALTFMTQPSRRVVVADPSLTGDDGLTARLCADEVVVEPAADLGEAAEAAARRTADCLVIKLDDLPAFADRLTSSQVVKDGVQTRLPIIAHRNGSAAPGDAVPSALRDQFQVAIADTLDAVADLVAFYLHCPLSKLPDAQRERLLRQADPEQSLAGRKVLIVDDDMRNIFALSSILEDHEAAILSADNGRDAIRILQEDPSIEIVLMDIMMPEMDGMETMRAIRKIPRLRSLPIVAVTAKAMKGDREKCIEAGAWDYLSKPVDADQLLGVLRSWLNR
jgi:signal transduction histidine kinase/DNA-binding response OmpR family regulator